MRAQKVQKLRVVDVPSAGKEVFGHAVACDTVSSAYDPLLQVRFVYLCLTVAAS